jgi:hypothetical protein
VHEVDQITKTIDEQVSRIRDALKDRMLTKVAEATGLHVNTVRNIVRRPEKSFSLSTIKKLSAYLFPSKE